MSRLEANLALLIITLYAAIQYVVLKGVPSSVSAFAFLALTNGFGFFITLFFFSGELFRVDIRQIRATMLLSVELIAANALMIVGAEGVAPSVSACVVSAYFVFIPVVTFFMTSQKPDLKVLPGILLVLIGLILMMEASPAGFLDRHVLYLIAADIIIAIYIITFGQQSVDMNPAILAMGQMFFSGLFAAAAWIGEVIFKGGTFALPAEPKFWASVIYVTIFIRVLYGIIQAYAMRYVAPLDVALITSTEVIMAMLISPIMAKIFDLDPDEITPVRAVGALLIVCGIVAADPAFLNALSGRLMNERDKHSE